MIIRKNSQYSLEFGSFVSPQSTDRQSTIEPTTARLQRSRFSMPDHKSSNYVLPNRRKTPPPLNRMKSIIQPGMHSVQNLVQMISDRRKTFVKFGFKSVELDDERNLWPFIKDFLGKEQKGSMLVNELWSDGNLTKFVRQANLQQAKRMVKRLANTSKVQRQTESNKVFTNKDENEMKHKIQSTTQSKLQEEIQKKFQQRSTIIKLVENQIFHIAEPKHNKNVMMNVVPEPSTPVGHRVKFHKIPATDRNVITQLINRIDDAVDGTNPEKKKLDSLLMRLQDKIVERRIKSTSNQLRSKYN